MKEIVREILIYLGFVLLAGLLWWSLSREKHDQLLVTEHLKAEMEQAKKEIDNDKAMTEKVLDVNIETPSVPTGAQLRLFPSRVKVVVRVSEDDYANVTAEDVRTTVSLGSSAERNANERLKVKARAKDRHIKVVRVEPSEVEYLLEETE